MPGFPSQEIPDDAARYLQDIFVYQLGITDRRGGLRAITGVTTFTQSIVGLVQTTDPAGTLRVAALTTDGSQLNLAILSADYTSKVEIPIVTGVSTSPYPIVDAKPMLNGGTLIGVSQQYELGSTYQQLVVWRGSNTATYTTGTITSTYGSKTVTGSGTSWLANVAPGTFLTDGSGQFIGVVQSVASNTSITLEEPAFLAVAGAAYSAKPTRGFAPRVVSGEITSSTSTTAVTGSNTKFRDEGVTTTWRLFRRSDGAFIGTVATVTNNSALTLGANAAIALQNEEYYAINNAADFGTSILGTASKPGFLNAVYAGRQWYSNRAIGADAGGEWTNRLWYSDPEDPEAVDMSIVDGNYIPITSARDVNTPIRAIVPAYNSLLVLKEKETFALFGENENQFEPRKIIDDGCLSSMSAASYNGGVIWAGHDGIYFYNGVDAENLTENTLGSFYKKAVSSLDPRTYRMWAAVDRDHYFLHIQHVTPSVPVIKGAISTLNTEFTIVIYMPNNAATIFTNMHLVGSVDLGSSANSQDSWFAVNTSSGGRICSFNDIFDTDGIDALTCVGSTAGPDFYIESKRYSIGDGLRKKLFKQLMMHYLVGGDVLKLDTVVGLNTAGTTTTSTWGVTTYWWDKLATVYTTWDILATSVPTWDSLTDAVFFVKRIKFIKRSQYLAFRLYQNSNAVTNATIGAFDLAYKLLRPGRP